MGNGATGYVEAERGCDVYALKDRKKKRGLAPPISLDKKYYWIVIGIR